MFSILGRGGRAELLLDDHVAALGTERDLDGVSQLVDAKKDGATRIIGISYLFCHSLYLSS
jgi:hypothetical protein